MGNCEETNKALIDYGRINFSSPKICQMDNADANGRKQMREFSAHDIVKLYCYHYMSEYYYETKALYSTYSKAGIPNNVLFIDMGCGPATAGLAFMDVFGDVVSNVEYYGIDTSEAMLNMAEKMMKDGYGDKACFHKVRSFSQLDANFWAGVSEVPSLVVFNFSNFFSMVSPAFSEKLANQISNIMKKYPLNKYEFFILQAEGEENSKSCKVFKNGMRIERL